MKIQGMGYYDTNSIGMKKNIESKEFANKLVQDAKTAQGMRDSIDSIDSIDTFDTMGGKVQKEKWIGSISAGTRDSKDLQNLEQIQEQRARTQELLQKQKVSMRMIKNLLYLITPGMGKLLDENSGNDAGSHNKNIG